MTKKVVHEVKDIFSALHIFTLRCSLQSFARKQLIILYLQVKKKKNKLKKFIKTKEI